ncbi:hypothetical protein CCP3SC1AL1_3240003 [Gammaproteobacteria bacterium]
MAYKIKFPTKRQARIYIELRRIGATPRQADNFLKKHKIK